MKIHGQELWADVALDGRVLADVPRILAVAAALEMRRPARRGVAVDPYAVLGPWRLV